jgi:hypothetical protein
VTAAGDVVVQTAEGLYANSNLAAIERQEKCVAAMYALQRLALTVEGETTDPVAVTETAASSNMRALEDAGWHPRDVPSGGPTSDVLITRPKGAAPLLATVIADGEWLYPDAQRLWTHARTARDIGAHPLLIARKVAPVTFPLLSAMNARALQFYDLLTLPYPDDASRRSADAIGLPKVRAAAELHEHSMFTQLLNLLGERPDAPWAYGASDAFQDAIERGFADSPASTDNLARWAEQHTPLPTRWVDTIRAVVEHSVEHVSKPKARRKKAASKVAPETTGGYGRETTKSRVPIRAF